MTKLTTPEITEVSRTELETTTGGVDTGAQAPQQDKSAEPTPAPTPTPTPIPAAPSASPFTRKAPGAR